MKKYFLLLAAALMVVAAGCQKQEGSDIPGYDESKDENKPTGVDDPTVTPETQIETTAKAFMEALDVPNWQADAEFVHNVALSLQSKRYDYSVLEDWADDLAKAWDKGSKQENGNTIYTTMVRLSDAKGHFEEQPDGTFSFTKANDFQITVNVDGESVTATFSCTDSMVPVRVSSSSHGYSSNGYSYSYEYNYTYVYVPTSATLKILRGGMEFASMTLNTTVDVKNPDEPDPFTDSASLNASVKVGVYTIGIQKVEYSPTGANLSVKLLNGDNSLLSATAAAHYSLNSNNKDIPIKEGSATAAVDVMGKIQFKGELPDYPAFRAAMEKVTEEEHNGGYQLSTALAAFEKTFSMGMYFNGASAARATLGFEAMKKDTYSSYWSIIPVLRFTDGQSIGFEDYFSEERFGGLIEYSQNWMDNIKRTVDGLFGDIF